MRIFDEKNKNTAKLLKVIKDYDKAIELDPNYTMAYNNRGNAKAEIKIEINKNGTN